MLDLHAHTVASDGGDRPEELVAAAATTGVETLAVTDHDTVGGVAEARAAGERLGVEVLAGCELTATVGDRVVHVLVYGEGLLEPELAHAVEAARRGRSERNLAIGERLERLWGSATTTPSAWPGPASCPAPTTPGRWSPAGRGRRGRGLRPLPVVRPAYVPAPPVPVTDAVALAAKAGGVAVLAHPGRLAAGERDRVLAEALEVGIDGIEVWHSQHDPGLRRSLAALAERPGLLASGGSDYHGRHKPDVRVGTGCAGNVTAPPECLASLRRRLASPSPAE